MDLDKGVVDYYHDDEKSSETMHKLFTDVGLKCKIRYDGVSCTGLDRNNIKKVTKRLAGATGMDLRVAKTKYQREHWRTALEKIPGMGKRCRITTAEFDPVGVETCLIEEKIKAKE